MLVAPVREESGARYKAGGRMGGSKWCVACYDRCSMCTHLELSLRRPRRLSRIFIATLLFGASRLISSHKTPKSRFRPGKVLLMSKVESVGNMIDDAEAISRARFESSYSSSEED
jgi:hypothetical protein